MRYVKIIFFVILFFFSILFFIQNNELITSSISLKLEFLGFAISSPAIPLYLLVLSSFVLGAFVTVLYLLSDRIKIGSQLKEARKKIKELEKELSSLRNIPLNENDYNVSSNNEPEAQQS
ncbi:MAG: LapA family protein [Desulfonauticus sp.]|nr:LapA family protein [Desulfonauticus sp.]